MGEAAYRYFKGRCSGAEDWESGGNGWTTSDVKQNEDPAGPPRDPLPPRGPVYLRRGYPSSVKGGTVIAGDVRDREEHAARLADPARYRPGPCRRCGGKMHAHDFAARRPIGEAPVEIRRYACPRCGGVVRVLPQFLARNLRGGWAVVEAVCTSRPGSRPTGRVSPRTGRRWRARGRTPARPVLHAMSASGDPGLRQLVTRLGLEATRQELLAELGRWKAVDAVYAVGAVLANLLLPGLRMM